MRTGRSLASCLGVALCALVVAAQANAETDAGFSFEWIAPEGCPSFAAVEAEIDRLLGGPAAAHSKQALRVHAEVVREALWQVTLLTTSGEVSGHRTLEASTCDGLANATALIVALMIDPSAVAAHEPMSADQTGPVAPSASPPPRSRLPAPPLAPPKPLAPSRGTHGLVGASVSGNLGLLPAPDVELGGELGMAAKNWRLELRAGYGPRQVKSDVLTRPAGAYGEFQAVFVGNLAGCLTASHAALEFGPCLDVEAGVIHGQGVGASTPLERYQPWVGIGAGGLLAVRLGHDVSLPVHLDAVVPLWRPQYVITNTPTPL